MSSMSEMSVHDGTEAIAAAGDATVDNVLHAKNNTNFPASNVTPTRLKRSGMDFYTNTLGSPKYVVAPMVDQSELAWRLLSRRHGAQLCYSPMYHSTIFSQEPKYREQALQTCAEDRPLIIQFCGNDPKIMLEAALMAQDHCDAIDINLGCPQAIAKRGHYGSFLQDEWDLLQKIVSTLHENLSVPITCKIRRFESVDKTVEYAKMLVDAGCQMLTVHGRTREQKGPLTGLADWSYIKAVRDNVAVPILANGNILAIEDIDRCLSETSANGVMTAEGNLHNPAIFDRDYIPVTWTLAYEYLDLVEQYPCPPSYIRGHLFKIFHYLLNLKCNADIRHSVATSHKLTEFRSSVDRLYEKFAPFHDGTVAYDATMVDDVDATEADYNLRLPPWICQPYIRMEPDKHIQMLAEKMAQAEDPNRVKPEYFDENGQKISRKTMKRLSRSKKPNVESKRRTMERNMMLCTRIENCGNPMGIKCAYELCRVCCRVKCYAETVECCGHKFLMERKNRRAKPSSKNEENQPETVE